MSDKDLYATLLQVDVVLSKSKAKMPDLTASVRRAKTAEEVVEHIQSAWLTYGAGDVSGTSFKLDKEEMPEAESGEQLDLFDGAMKYLWFKTKDKGSTRRYTMRGIPYAVQAVDKGGIITVTAESDEK